MATLTALHWEAITPKTQQLLAVLGQLPMLSPFYLAGGTALALRLGNRISQDLDLFADIETLEEDRRRSIIAALQPTHSISVLQDSPLGLVMEVDGLAVSLFSYGYALLAPTDLVSNVQVASLLDIGLMKLDAIAGRGLRKDFYDLYFIAPHISLDELFARSVSKYPHARGFVMRALTALVDFDLAEQQAQPILLAPITWDQVKAFCLVEARRLGQTWFGHT